MPSRTSPTGFKPLEDTQLFKPLKLGALNLEHRVMMAPLTRMRAPAESPGIYVPSDLNVEYYSQRASQGGFQLTEACPISRYACGYPGVPGIFTQSQGAGWKKVTEAIHAKGGFIFCQLWHVGRATVPSFLDGRDCVSSSGIPITGKALDGSDYDSTPPIPLTVEEIQDIVQDFASAAVRAIEAGFDGVEIHGGNGYLLDQFLHDNINTRTDSYGGSMENRSRFPLEVIKAVTLAIGAERVGIRLSPYNYFQDTRDSNPNEHWAYLCERIIRRSLGRDWKDAGTPTILPRGTFYHSCEEERAFPGAFPKVLENGGVKFVAAGNFNAENAVPKIESGEADAIIFGRHYIANPDLPRRLAEGLPLNPYDRSTFYGAEPPSKGYVDYPYYKDIDVAA
ncbi:hypothetical protein CLAIMM_11187 [Cladophialophora immunda]|nr:hypothetical protein CLAIMM_11187 [Cladophialophora immunda]